MEHKIAETLKERFRPRRYPVDWTGTQRGESLVFAWKGEAHTI